MRLIDADELMKHEHEIYVKEVDYRHRCIDILEVVEAPTIEAEPRKHGRWRKTAYGYAKCSVCEELNTNDYFNYCPDCGAKMDEEADDATD